LSYNDMNAISIKLASNQPTANAFRMVEDVIRKYEPTAPFEYDFVEEGYAAKFADVERIGKLSGFFTILAISISCLGIFGLASFIAERRTKEIGVRKVLGASVFSLWKMLSRDFVLLVVISTAISIPIACYVMSNWLQFYEYRTDLSWWIFGLCAVGALVITLLTVSYQSVKASMANPVKSLRNE
ncbi:MAG TPA: FtsX-like permease family protein, partial [Cyclobacteriaceae bacterium]